MSLLNHNVHIVGVTGDYTIIGSMKETLFANINRVHADQKVTVSYCSEIVVKMYSPSNNSGIIYGLFGNIAISIVHEENRARTSVTACRSR